MIFNKITKSTLNSNKKGSKQQLAKKNSRGSEKQKFTDKEFRVLCESFLLNKKD